MQQSPPNFGKRLPPAKASHAHERAMHSDAPVEAARLVDALMPGRPYPNESTMLLAALLGIVTALLQTTFDALAIVGLSSPTYSDAVPEGMAGKVIALLLGFIVVEVIAGWRLWARQPVWAPAVLLLIAMIQILGQIPSEQPIVFMLALVMGFFASNALRGALALRKARARNTA